MLPAGANRLRAAVAAGLDRAGHAPVHEDDRSAQRQSGRSTAFDAVDRLLSRMVHGARFAEGDAPRSTAMATGLSPESVFVADSRDLGELLAAHPNGVFQLTVGGSRDSADAARFGVREVVRRDPVVTIGITRHVAGQPPTHWMSAVQTHAASVARTRDNVLVGIRELVAIAFANPNGGLPGAVALDAPSFRFGPFLQMRQLLRAGKAGLQRLAFFNQWILGFAPVDPDAPPSTIPRSWTPLIPPLGHTWADPFVVERDGATWLFFEEQLRQSSTETGHGRIVVARLGPHGIEGPIMPALRREYHLSYPFVFEHGGQWYMVPASSTQARIDLYRCTRWPDGWEFDSTLVADFRGTDASLLFEGGRWWMFVGRSAPGAPTADELHLFAADDLRGPWRHQGTGPVMVDARRARPAGRPFVDSGRVIRPTQDCSAGTYGRRIELRAVNRIGRDDETVVATIEPTWCSGLIGTHTFNRSPRFAVIDGCRRAWRLSAYLASWRRPRPEPPRPRAARIAGEQAPVSFERMKPTEADLLRYKRCFDRNGSTRSIERLRWQFLEPPARRLDVWFAVPADAPDDVAAVYAVLPIHLRVGGRRLLGCQSLDTLTDARFRGRGIFIELAREGYASLARDGYACVYGLPNRNSAHGFFDRLDWVPLDPVPFIARPLRTSGILRRVAPSLSRFRGPILVSRQRAGLAGNQEIVAVSRFDAGFDDLWRRFSAGVGVAVERDSEYLNWRIASKPGEQYLTLALLERGQLLGAVIFCVKDGASGRNGYVMDLLHDPSREDVGGLLLQTALAAMVADGAEMAIAWSLPGSPNYDVFRRELFVRVPRRLHPIELHFGVHPLVPSVSGLMSDRKQWYVSYLDSDTT